MRHKFGLFVALITTKWTLVLAQQCQLLNVKAENVTSTSLWLTWTQNGDCFIQDYKIKAEHLTYRACPSLISKTNETISIEQNGNSAFISGLEPYSIYQLSVHGLDNGDQTVMAPNVEVSTPN